MTRTYRIYIFRDSGSEVSAVKGGKETTGRESNKAEHEERNMRKSLAGVKEEADEWKQTKH